MDDRQKRGMRIANLVFLLGLFQPLHVLQLFGIDPI
jgi:hypothetical protein